MLLIGSRIQEYRKKAGLNQEEFAEKMGVSRQAVSKWERDKAYPDLDRLVCICEILDVQVGELIYGKGEELKELLADVLREGQIYIERLVPYDQAGSIARIRKYGQVVQEEFLAEGISVKAYVPMEVYSQI